MTQDHGDNLPSSAEKADKPARRIALRLFIYTTGTIIFILVLLVLGVYVWKTLAVRSLEQRLEFQETEMARERQQALHVQARDMLRLTALPLAWAVRTEMMRGNLNQIDDYFRDFVKETGVLSVLLIDRENRVALASNRKLEAQPADSVVSQAIQNADNIVIEESESFLRLGVPIMSFNEKLGILVVDYRPQDSQTPKPQP